MNSFCFLAGRDKYVALSSSYIFEANDPAFPLPNQPNSKIKAYRIKKVTVWQYDR
jgi:hypothetical protein